MKLNKQDYNLILSYYNIFLPKNTPLSIIKNVAENLIATKLCSCIKHIKNDNQKDESKEISICKNSVVNKKGLKFKRFTCKKKPKIFSLKKTKNKLSIK